MRNHAIEGLPVGKPPEFEQTTDDGLGKLTRASYDPKHLRLVR